jgi:hypothetical protein
MSDILKTIRTTVYFLLVLVLLYSSSDVPHNAHDIRYPDTDKKEHPAELMPAESETEKKD